MSRRRKLLLETIEPRILCSVTAPADAAADPQPHPEAAPMTAAPGPDATAPAAPAEATNATADQATAPTARELIVVNGNLAEADQLIAELTQNLPGRTFEILRLDTNRDGVEQITQYLAAAGGKFSAIHLLAHGDDGSLNLGATHLDARDLSLYSAQLSQWGLSLESHADLLIYGCNFAAGATGQQLVQELAQLTGADVAASTDKTGSALLGGDWQLEYLAGAVESALPAQDISWGHLLAGTPIDGGVGSFAGVIGNRIYSISFDTGKATLVGTSNYVGSTGTLNSLGIDSVNSIIYYADSASGSRAIYGFDLKTGGQFILTSDVTTFGVTLPTAGMGAAGGDFAGGSYYFSTEGGGTSSRDQIFQVTFVAGSNGRTIQSITRVNQIPGANEFGDFIITPGSTTKLWAFNSGVSVDEYNLVGGGGAITAIATDPNANVSQGAIDRSGNLYTVGSAIYSYNPAGSGTFGTPRTITTNGTTGLGTLADGSAWVSAEASIGDRVWYDADLDGTQDAGETGVVGLTVSLYDDLNGNGALDAGERLLATTTTGANGAYSFGQLLPGDYLIRVTDPTSIMGGAQSTTGGTTQSASITLVGQAVTNRDFGFERPATISVSSPTVTEGADAFAVFTVSLSNPLFNAVTLNLALANGSATGGGTDYGSGAANNLQVSTDGGATWIDATTATIAAGSTSVLVRTPLTNDALDEANETFTLTATRSSGLTANTSGAGTATIVDNDPTPSLSINDLTLNEATGTATFTVTLNTASGQSVTVNYATSNGTAVAGSDYTSTSGSLTFNPGITTQTITVPITNDTIFENSETFNVNLSGAVNATIADNLGVGTIRDDGTGTGGTNNDTPTLSVTSPTVAESAGFAVFTVSLSNASTTPVTLGLALANVTATGGGTDYGSGGATNLQVSNDGGSTWVSATTATIAAGTTSVLVRTPIINDPLNEAAETFTLAVTRTAGTTTNASVTGTATITDDDPTPSLTINDVTVNEGAGTATFTVTLNTASGQNVTVNYATSGGTAAAGADFTTTSGTLTFAPGSTTQTFTVPIANDTTFETSETFNVNLSGASNATIADALGVGTIRDDGAGVGGTDNDTPTISVSSPTVTEGADAFAIFTVSLSNPSTQAISGNLTLTAGSATGGGVDYGSALEVSTDGGVTWFAGTTGTLPAGNTSILVRTPINNDTLSEASETFTLTATRTAGVTTNASAVGTATIVDNDALPGFSIGDITVNEGAGTATFTVTLSAPSGQPTSVNFATSSGSATSGTDFTAVSGTLNFGAGTTTQTITVPIANDTTFENSETFNVTLSGAVNATIADNLGIGTIRDDGTGAGGTDNDTPTLSVNNVTVTEGVNAHAVFTVSLSNPSTTPVTVSLALANGTAVGGGTDFGTTGAGNLQVSTDGGTTWIDATTATIGAGSTSVLVRTPLVNDALNEANETFALNLNRTAGTTTNSSLSATGTIVDNDAVPALSIDDVTVNEAAGTATFTVTLNAPSGQPISVNYATSSGSATSGSDFTGASGTLNFAAGVTSQTIVVPITNDATFENTETFNVQLSAATNATLAKSVGVGTIRDDGTGSGGSDDDTPTLTVSSPTVVEGTDAFAIFTVGLSNLSTTPVTVNLSLTAGTATGGGTDFGPSVEVSTDGGATWAAAGSVTIGAGSSSVLVRTPINNDTLDEAAENFTLTATRTSGTTTNASAAGTATITDNDPPPSLTINDVTVNEAAGTATFTVSLSTASGLAVNVNYATGSGSAGSGSDFTSTSGTLTFAPGVVTQTVTVPITNDAIFESSESFDVTLSGAVNASIADALGVGTIRDDGTGSGGTDNDTPTLSVSDITVAEGTDSFAVFTVSLSNISTTPVTVSLALADASATGAGFDYGASGATNLQVSTDGGASWANATTATIAAGNGSVLVRTPLANDAVNEPTETFTLTATRTAGATANLSATGTATITDNDTLPGFFINDVTVNEATGTATFTVSLTAASGQPTAVTYSTSSGTALAGSDFVSSSGVLNFAPGVTSQTVTVPILNDAIFEGSETFNVNLSNAVNAGISDPFGIGTIRDDGSGTGGTDNDTPTLTVSDLSVTEGVNAFAVFTVGISNPSTTPVAVSLALANGTATGGGADYGAGGPTNLQVSTDGGATWVDATTATIAAGNTSVLVRTPVANDSAYELAETFTLTATRTSGSTTNASAIGTATIADNDPLPALSVNDITVNEATGTATFTVTLNTASGLPVTVNYSTSDVGALAGADYTATSGALTFAAGVTSQTITVPILNDAIFEGSETFQVTLSGATGATIADGLGVGTIRDDGTGTGGTDNDTPALSVSDPLVTEGTDAFAVFTVSLTRVSTTPVTASLALANGSATGGADFGPTLEVSANGGATWTSASSVTIPAGATSVLVRTPVIDDALNEAAEIFTLTATRTAGSTTNLNATGTATIADNDALPSLTIDDVTVNEAAGTATFTVRLNTASGQTVSVNYGTSDGTAADGGDYTAATGTLTFAPGVTSQTIVVPILNDTPFEGAETFNVNLTGAVNATIADPLGVGTIRDDGTGTGGNNDDRPVNGLPPSFSGFEDTPLVLTGISVSGPAPNAVITVTFTVTNGVLNLSTGVAGGVGAGEVTGNGSSSVSITAQLSAINATLADAAGLTFVSTADYNGSASLTMATVNGLGSDSDVSTINVAPVVDIANDTALTDEDIPVTIVVLGNDTFENPGATITAVDGQAIVAGGPAVAVSTGTVSLALSGQLTYTPNTNYNGGASFTYTVTSGGSTETATVNVTVTPQNDPLAVSNPTSAAGLEDTPVVFSTANGNALTIEDVDGGQLEVVLSVPTGTLSLNGVTGLSFTVGDGTGDGAMTFRGTATDITAALEGLTFTPNADFNGNVPLTFTVRDVGSPVASLVNGGFEQPGGVVGGPQFNESLVNGWDTSASDNLIEIWQSGFNGGGGPGVPSYEGSQFAEINATQSATLSQVITVPADAALTYSFAHRGRLGVDVMNVRIVDLGTDGQLGGGDDTVLLNENFSDGNTAWGVYTRNVGIATGNPLLLEFTSVSTATGNPSVGNFVDGVSLIAEQFIPKTINIAVAPVVDIADDSATTNEDTPVTIPVLTNDSFESPAAAITAVDGQALTPGGAAVPVANGSVALDNSNQLIFTPAANFNGPTTFTYTVTSGGVTETASVNVNVLVENDPPTVDLNGPGGGTGYATTFTENGAAVAVIGSGVTLADLDSTTLARARVVLNNAQAGDTLTIFGSLPPGISGTIDTSIPGQITVEFTGSAPLASYEAALQQIRFANSNEDPSTAVRNFSVTVNDGALDSNVATSSISVVAINDAPGVTVPSAQTTDPGVPRLIPGISFSDADAGGSTVTVTLSVTGGSLSVANAVAGGLTAGQISGNGTGTVTLTGTLAAINTTLADASGLSFLTNTSGGYTLTAEINDGGNSGVDPSTLSLPATGSPTDERGSGTVALTVTPPTLSLGNVSVTEGADPFAVFTISLSNPSSSPVTLALALGSGTALGAGVDFGAGTPANLQVSTDGGATWVDATTATIAAGATSVLVRTPITDDALDEDAETFTLAATVTSGTLLNDSATGVGTIADNDALPAFSINDVTVNEAAGTATFTVSLNAPSGRPVTVDYATSNGTASAGADFSAVSGTLTFAAGVTSQTITIPILNDSIFEGSESFNVDLSNAVNATIADALGIGTIRDDGTGPGGSDNDTPSFSVSNVLVTEGTDPHAVFTISLSNLSTTPVSFSLALADGSATGGGVDYGAGLEVSTDGGVTWTPSTTATIAGGSASVLVRTPIADDALDEIAEAFSLTATRSAGSTLNVGATGTATIADDDAPPALSIDDVTVNEAAGTATFTVTLNAPSGQTVQVSYLTNSGSATSGVDFTATTGGLTFAPGVTSQTITVPITNDAIFEGGENFTVTLVSPTNATFADDTGLGTIADDGTGPGGSDDDTPTLSVSNVSVTEGADPHAVFAVTLSNLSTTPVTVALALTAGSATGGGTDFSDTLEVSTDGGITWAPASSATIAPGQTSVLVRTAITDDLLDEDAEDFTLTANVSAGTTTNAAASGTATIADDDAEPTLSIDDVTVNEGAGTATFTVTLSAASGKAVSVNYATSSGTALSGADFSTTTGTLNFGAGVISQTITVPILNDAIYEGSETFDVLLAAAVNATIADGTGAGTILDDGTGGGGTDDDTPTLSITSPTVTEGTDPHAIFTLALSNPSSSPVAVSLALANGSATGAGTDFGPALEVSTDGGATWTPALNATIAAGETSVLVRTPITDDALDENTENFTLTATVTAGTTVNPAVIGTATITDDDPTPSLSIDNVTVNEAAGTATFTVTLSAASALPVSVNFATASGNATSGADFTGVSGALNFAAGVVTQTIVVPILDDAIFEQSETFDVQLSGAVNATIATGTGVGTILDDGTGGGGSDDDTPTLSVGNVAVIEGTDGFAVFTVSLSKPSVAPVTVGLALANGGATGAGTDYGSAGAGNLQVSTDGGASWVDATAATFSSGETSVLVRTPITDDALDESAENFTLTATVTGGVTTNANATGTATITDDDPTPTLSIDDVTVNEGAGTLTFTVTLSAASALPISVDYATSDGTALAGLDYTLAAGTLNFAPGIVSQTVVVPIANDAIFEQSENFSVVLSAPSNATVLDGTGIGTILDDGTGGGGSDNDRPTLAVSSPLVTEGIDAFAVFNVTLSNPSTTPVSINVALADGTALGSGTDFGPGLEVSLDGGVTWSPAATATFAPGETSVLVRTPVINDPSSEIAENFTLTANVTAGLTTNATAVGTATIADDDAPPTLSVDDVLVSESGGTVTFTITLNTASGFPVSVNYATADGTARAGGDYASTTGSLTFAPGETVKTVTVNILDDSFLENRESFSLVLSSPTNAAIDDGTGLALILDDDVRQATLTLAGTSSAGTAGNNLVVGEVATYELQVELAEGANPALTLHSFLPAGMRFLPDAPVEVGFLNVQSSVTGLAAGSYDNTTLDGLISASLTADDDVFGDGTGVFFKLGLLTSNDAADGDREFVTVRFRAIVENTLANQAGTTLDANFGVLVDTDASGTPGYVDIDRDADNAATGTEVANDPLDDGTGAAGLSNTVTAQVVEPILVLDKQITSAPAAIRAGDTITYTITLSHAVGSGATAWEATLADTVPTGLQITQIDTVTLAGGAQEQSAAAIGGGGATLGGVWDVPVGGTVTIVYRATVTSDAVLGSTLSNLADLTWSTLDGTEANERGSGDGLLDGGGLNDQQLQEVVSATIDGGASDFALSKQIIGDTNAEIGERLTYQLTLNVADGVITGLSLNDLIPAGFRLVNGSATAVAGAGVTLSGVNFTYTASQLTLDIAQLQSAVDGNANTVTITYTVDVLDSALNDAFGGAATSLKTNLADASYDPGSGPITAQDSLTVNVVEPVLAATESVLSAPAQANAGDLVTFQIVIGHGPGSTGSAYNVLYTDTLPAAFGNVQLVAVTGTATTLPALSDFNVSGNTITTLNSFDIGLGEQVILTYSAVLQDTVTPGEVLTNNALVTAESTDFSPSLNTRTAGGATNSANYQATGAASLTADATFDVAKLANVTTARIGDRVRYTITVNVIEGTTPSLVLNDLLPAGMPIDTGSVQITYGAPGMAGSNAAPVSFGAGSLDLDFGDLVNPGDNDATNDTITIEYEEVVSDVPGNTNGALKTNNVSGTYAGLTTPATASVGVTLVEPVLNITKSVDDPTPRLGQTVTYTVVVSHDGASTSDAFDLTLDDALPPGLALNAASIQLASAPAGTSIVANTSVDGGPLALTLNQLALGESVTITFTATVSTDPAIIGGTFGGVDDTLGSTLALGYDSQAGVVADQRSSSGSVDASVTVVGADLAVTIDDGQATANAGDRLTYTITVTNNGTDAATNVVLTDVLPPGSTFVPGLSTPGSAFVAGNLVYTIPSLAVGATETFTVVVDLPNPTPAGEESTTSLVSVTHDDIEPTPADNAADDTDTLTSVPDYEITVTDNRTSAKPGETLEYVITVRNVGTQNGTGVVVSDVFTTGLFASLIADQGGVVDLVNGTVTWNVGDLDAGETITLTLRGTLNPTFTSIPVPIGTIPGAIPDNDAIGHELTVDDDAAGGADPTPANNTAIDLDDLQPVPELRVTLADKVTIANPGQQLTYTIVATNAGLQDSSGMIVTATLPKGVKLVRLASSDAALSGTPTLAGGVITWTFTGPVPAGEAVTFTVVVRVAANVTPGSELVTRVTIEDDGTYGPDAKSMADNAARDTNAVPIPEPPPAPRPEPPAARPAPFVYAFDVFNDFAKRELPMDVIFGQLPESRPIDFVPAAILPVVPIYSGAAEPGATLVISLYNSRGERIGSQTVVADSGGNWLATFPSTSTRDLPNTVEISALAAPYTSGGGRVGNLRTYFTPAISPGHFFFQLGGSGSLGDEEAPLLGGLGLENPLQLGNVKYGGELLGTQATASGY